MSSVVVVASSKLKEKSKEKSILMIISIGLKGHVVYHER
jgi:hypothetical protein